MDRTISEAPLEQLPVSLRQLLTFERFHLHRPEMYINLKRDPSFDRSYLPYNCGAFQLPVLLDRAPAHVRDRRSAQRADEVAFQSGDCPEGRVLFPIHPTSHAYYAEFPSKVRTRDAAEEGLRLWAVHVESANLSCRTRRRGTRPMRREAIDMAR